MQILTFLLALTLCAGTALAQSERGKPDPKQTRQMKDDERRRMRDDMREAYRERQGRPERPRQLSPEEREKLRYDIEEANRQMRRKMTR